MMEPRPMTHFLPPPQTTRLLGQSGIAVSPLAWGMWRFKGSDLRHADRLVRAALDAGISLLDTADIYGLDNGESFGAAESLLGRVLEADPSLRRRFVLAGKGGIHPPTPYDSSSAYLLSACDSSLRRLKTDTIDLYQIHRPDTLAHPQEVAETLVKLHDAGKIRAAGVSNYSVRQTTVLQSFLPFQLAAQQPEFSALYIEPIVDGVLDQAMERDMAVLAWSPLGGGRLGGEGGDLRARDVIAVLDTLALRESASRTDVALAWVMAHPSRPIPILGTQNVERLGHARRALDVRLTRDDWYAVLTASRQKRLP
jgi:predicted oxidoreductase